MSSTTSSKISIIGCGWLGLPLAQYLIAQGFSVLGSSTTASKLATLAAAGIQPYLIRAEPELKGEGLTEFFSSPILVINVPPRRRREKVEEIHFIEVKNIIDAAQRIKVKKIIFCSSTGVYPDNNAITTEENPVNPSSPSSRALVKIENYLRAQTNLQSTILRFAGLVGGDRKAGRFLAGKKDVANGDAPVNLVHREDCIRVIHEIIRRNVWEETLNVCADEHPLRRDFYPQQAMQLGLEPPTFLHNQEPDFKIISNEKIKRLLDFEFKYPDPQEF